MYFSNNNVGVNTHHFEQFIDIIYRAKEHNLGYA